MAGEGRNGRETDKLVSEEDGRIEWAREGKGRE